MRGADWLRPNGEVLLGNTLKGGETRREGLIWKRIVTRRNSLWENHTVEEMTNGKVGPLNR
jgi:hypothetical protein